MAYSGSYLTAKRDHKMENKWRHVAEKVFGVDSVLEQSSEDNGLFDRNIISCSFKGKFLKVGEPLPGCDFFDQMLTTNGLCHSFNGINPSKIWKNSNVAFEKVIGRRHKGNFHFGGSGSEEGKSFCVF